MRSIIIFAVLVFVIAVSGIYISHAGLAPSDSTNGVVKPYVYVHGGVHAPGRYDWFAGMTVIDAIKAAGGFTDSAGHRIKISHIDGHGESFDWDTLDVTNKPPILRQSDSIFVPKRIF